MNNLHIETLAVFFVTLLATFFFSYLARRHSQRHATGDALEGRNLNKWLIGLSAGATANSGFVVTAAVGLGYSYGMQWLLLPLAWLLGDLIFWQFFPHRINAFGHRTGAATLSDMLTNGLSSGVSADPQSRWLIKAISVGVALIVIASLGGYAAAQWKAGEKFIAASFGVSSLWALLAFALVLLGYTIIGGFRGSVFADTFQAVLRLGATCLAVAGMAKYIQGDWSAFEHTIRAAGSDFLLLAPNSLSATLAFMAGFAAAAIGFGFQPQILSRYLAGRSPADTRSAKWIYLFFVQFTWIAMTLFGVGLRGVFPTLADPEMGLAIFFQTHFGPVVVGLILADIFATIGATTNSILVSVAQTLKYDLLPKNQIPLSLFISIVGVGTLLLAATSQATVMDLAIRAVSLMAAAFAAPAIARAMDWQSSALSVFVALVCASIAAVVWRDVLQLHGWMNEALPGIAVGLLTHFIFARFVRP